MQPSQARQVSRSWSVKPPPRARRARAVVEAVTHWQDAAKLAEISTGLGEAMRGTESAHLPEGERLAQRGW